MKTNQAIVVTDKNHPKFDKGGIVVWKRELVRVDDLAPDFIVGFVDGEQFFLNEDQIKEA